MVLKDKNKQLKTTIMSLLRNGLKYLLRLSVLSSLDLQLLRETKTIMSAIFQMKTLGEAHYVLGIEIISDRQRKLLCCHKRATLKECLTGLLWRIATK